MAAVGNAGGAVFGTVGARSVHGDRGPLARGNRAPFGFLFVGNVACFVPFGFGLPALTPLRRAVVPLCFLGSLLVEALQWAFGTGIPQVEDILLNTLGAALGYALFHAKFAPP